MLRKLAFILILVISLAIASEAVILSSMLQKEGQIGNFTTGESITLTFVGSKGHTLEADTVYWTGVYTQLLTNTLNWIPTAPAMPLMDWAPGDVATVEITYVENGITYKGSGIAKHPNLSFGGAIPGIINLLLSAEFPPYNGDNGLIQNTQITREVNGDIKLTWEFDVGITEADIWRIYGTDQEFTTDALSWSKVNISPISATEFTDPDLAAQDSQNAYYRVVPTGVAQLFIFSADPGTQLPYNARTVGKIDIDLLADDVRFISLPMYAGSMKGLVLAGQTLSGSMYFYPQSGAGLGAFTFNGTTLLGDFDAKPGDGFWLENDATPKVITFVGSFETFGERTIADADVTGNPIPYAFQSATLGGADGDTLYPQSGAGLGAWTRSSGNWPAFEIGLTDAFWYEKTGDRAWQIDLYKGAVIEAP